MSENTVMQGVREYCEGMEVALVHYERLVVKARNEAGFNCTQVDLLDLLAWVRKHRPELMRESES